MNERKEARPVDLIEDGVLWYINRTMFHPRGFALGFSVDADDPASSTFVMLGDGREVWTMGSTDEDEKFKAFEALLKRQRGEQLVGEEA